MRVVAALILALLSPACDPPEWQCRQVVKQLVEAGPTSVNAAMDRVVEVGPCTIVDIEQSFHGGSLATRLRLLEALRRLGSPEGLPILRFYARWDDEPQVREAAKKAAASLQR